MKTQVQTNTIKSLNKIKYVRLIAPYVQYYQFGGSNGGYLKTHDNIFDTHPKQPDIKQ